MLHTIGLILKIIGIILAIVLGILVLLICTVLFVPICYEIEGKFPGDINKIQAHVKGSWLFHLISGKVVYQNGDFFWWIKLFWKKFESDVGKEFRKEEINEKERGVKKEEDSLKEERDSSRKLTSGAKEKTFASQKKEKKMIQIENLKKGENRKKEQPVLEKIIERIWAVSEKIKYTFSEICDKIRMILNGKEKLVDFWDNEIYQSAFARIKKESVWLKRFLKPRKVKIELEFGFEDPCCTGKVLAGLSMICPFVGEYMNIHPNFETKVLKGELYIKGNLRMIHLLILCGKLVCDQNIRTTYRDSRKVLGI